MKQELTIGLKTLLIALVIGLGTLVAFGSWSEPTDVPPNANTTPPINGSNSIQEKAASLNVFSDVGAKTTSDLLSIFGTSYFAGDVSAGKNEGLPDDAPDVDVYATGKIGINLDEGVTITPSPSQAIDVNGETRFSALASLVNPDATYPAPVCITESGTLFLCPQPGALYGLISGPDVDNQDVFIDIIENNSDDYNCSADVSFTGSANQGVSPYEYSWKVKNNSTAPLVTVNGTDASGGGWVNVGSSTSTTFHVYEKNPQSWGRDDWTIEFTVTDHDGTVATTEQDFEAWTIPECND